MGWLTLPRQLVRGVRAVRATGLCRDRPSAIPPLHDPAGQDAAQFIILCAARTGSTMLRHLLNSHPEVCCHGEVMTSPALEGFVGLDGGGSPIKRKLMHVHRADPRRFLEDFVLYAGEAKAIGFKIKYEELVLPDYGWLLEWLKDHRPLSVIHLRRENRLKRFVSQLTATEIYRVYNVMSEEERPAPARVSPTPEECLADFSLVEARESLFRRHFEHHRTLETTYEDVVSGRDDVLGRIAEFLRIAPAPLTAKTLKINPDDLREVLGNYEALATALRDTAYAAYFES